MDLSSLIVGMLAGAVGVGFIVYGRKQQRIVAFVVGIALCVAPYGIDNAVWCAVACAGLIALPFIFRV